MRLLPFGKAHPELPFHAANKNAAGAWLVSRLLIQPALSRMFHTVRAYVEPEALRLRRDPPLPVIFCLTHTGWWDGYVTAILNSAVFRHDGYLMMEEATLANYPFFTWIGVFGVDRHNPRKALASVDYAVKLLTQMPGRAVWIFPQGTIMHPDARPLRVFSGAIHIAKRVGRCYIVPVALRYEFRLEQAPEAFVYIGQPHLYDASRRRRSPGEATEWLDRTMAEADDTLHGDLVAGSVDRYRPILKGRTSVSRVWDGVLDTAERLRRRLGISETPHG